MNNYRVTFIGDYFTLTTYADADNEEQAIRDASALLVEHHGIDVSKQSFDIFTEID